MRKKEYILQYEGIEIGVKNNKFYFIFLYTLQFDNLIVVPDVRQGRECMHSLQKETLKIRYCTIYIYIFEGDNPNQEVFSKLS